MVWQLKEYTLEKQTVVFLPIDGAGSVHWREGRTLAQPLTIVVGYHESSSEYSGIGGCDVLDNLSC